MPAGPAPAGKGYQMKKIRCAVIGTGGRCQNLMDHLLRHAHGALDIAAVYDPEPSMRETFFRELSLSGVEIAPSAEAAIHTRGVEWVIVASPNRFHCEQILTAFAAGKNVFAEKPLATSIADCQAIEEAHRKAGTIFATGFVLRYSPLYVKAKELLDSGRFGKILSIEANENIYPEHGGYILTTWRRLRKFAGPHILEKCCHDMDLLEWFTDSLPVRVQAVAARRFFTPDRAYLLDKYPPDTLMRKINDTQIANPFTGDSDVDDTIFSVSEFRNGIIASFSATMCNPIPERRMRFHCEYGTLVVEFYTMTLRYHFLGEKNEQTISFGPCEGHGGGDGKIMSALWDSMQNGTAPLCSGSEGLRSAVFSLALDQAAHEHRIVDLEDVWKKLHC